MDPFVPVLFDFERRRHPLREMFEPFSMGRTPWFHTPHLFDPFDTVAVCTPWTLLEAEPRQTQQQQEQGASEGIDQWETSLSLEGFDKDNVKVTALDEHSVLVEAKKVDVDKEGGQYEYKHICRKLAVPEKVDMKTLKVELKEDGEMILRAGPPAVTDVSSMDTPEEGQGGATTAAESKPAEAQQVARQVSTDHRVTTMEPRDQDFKFNLKGYPPESIKVKVVGNRLTVQAKEEKKSDKGLIYRQFHQSVTIPRHIDADRIQSQLSQDGQLTIEAAPHQEREVEVKMEQ